MEAFLDIFASEDKTIEYLVQNQVIKTSKRCTQCRRGRRDDFKKKLSRCQHNSCRNQVNCKVPINKILL
ncbi:hypothetical protein HZS_2408 [Henneguya salminicola]|nr:hypothetical protein HZS_2408 [Henneguya salminicola]